MANDIASILTKTQAAIDKAVETIIATTETQQILKENIVTTDAKIGTHDHAETSHEDLRLILADQPSMITEPTITGPSAVETW